MPLPARIQIIDSHTEGEPTRCVLSGGPPLGAGFIADRLARFRHHQDAYRRAILLEPRGSDVLVGALLCEPDDPSCVAAVIFFNNAGYLGMCGHGTIGVIATLAHLGRIAIGTHRLQTPAGIVHATLHSDRRVTVENVPAYRFRAGVSVEVPGHGTLTGDIAWGGNWFFLIQHHGFDLTLAHVEPLTNLSWRIRRALAENGITGEHGAEIDHIELFAPGTPGLSDNKNFVLCPGNAYDRSPCGTGTSAKLACLYADGKLAPGHAWLQEGILGTVFEGRFRLAGEHLIPSVTGCAWITAESTLLFHPDDPFREGIAP
jgi:4-hydroxyproline epimerase